MKKKVTFGAKPSPSGPRKSPPPDSPESGDDKLADDWVAGEPEEQSDATSTEASITVQAEEEKPSPQSPPPVTEVDINDNNSGAPPPPVAKPMSNKLIIGVATLALAAVYGAMQLTINRNQSQYAADIEILERAHADQLQKATNSREALTKDYEGQLARLQGKMEARVDASEKARQQLLQQFVAESQQLRATTHKAQAQMKADYEKQLQDTQRALTTTKTLHAEQLAALQQEKTNAEQTAQTQIQSLKKTHVEQLKTQENTWLKRQETLRENFITRIQQLNKTNNNALNSAQKQLVASQEKARLLETEQQSLQQQVESLQRDVAQSQQMLQTVQAEQTKQLAALQAKPASVSEALPQQNTTVGQSEPVDNTCPEIHEFREARAWFKDGVYQLTQCIYQ